MIYCVYVVISRELRHLEQKKYKHLYFDPALLQQNSPPRSRSPELEKGHETSSEAAVKPVVVDSSSLIDL